MNAYVVASGRRLYPFDDAPADWRVLDRPLGEVQRRTLQRAGLNPIGVNDEAAVPAGDRPCLVLSDALYFSPEALDAFLGAARSKAAAFQAHAAAGLFAERVLWHLPRDAANHVPLPLWYLPRAGDTPAHSVALSLTLDEETLDLPMPHHMGNAPGKGLEQLLTRLVMVEITSWVNLYQANMQALMARVKRAKHLPWWRGLWAVVAGRGNLYGTMGRLNRIGKRCNIHPTAVIELSRIGDDVTIGAHAVVRMSVVGNGAVIDDHAAVRAVVVGEGASIANNNNVVLSVVYPRAFLISGPYQFSMFGSECAIMHCICCDTRLDGKPVRAEIGPLESVNSTQRYLGSCYGHGVRAGAGTITAPGRAIPNHFHFLPNAGQVVSTVDPTLPRHKSLFTEDGGLVYKGRPILPAEPRYDVVLQEPTADT